MSQPISVQDRMKVWRGMIEKCRKILLLIINKLRKLILTNSHFAICMLYLCIVETMIPRQKAFGI